MIVASIAAETGRVRREVSRSGDSHAMVTLSDSTGTIIVADLSADGSILIRVDDEVVFSRPRATPSRAVDQSHLAE